MYYFDFLALYASFTQIRNRSKLTSNTYHVSVLPDEHRCFILLIRLKKVKSEISFFRKSRRSAIRIHKKITHILTACV